ncbi:cilia- and flagella-associated protein 251-like [Copidosoma floridanum]|uniref:cilia- and flagella-associated protein 251-like n=1 Tax=Copidosoma floridanum TaxID=29053 RepID=UPI000C6F9787|nr:cilia- and flagella-associated protein 251-like [Copidosoma floridanum]
MERRDNDQNSTIPYTLELVFGMNSNLPLVNLSTPSRSLVAYACSHVVTLNYYDPVHYQHQFYLKGHFDCVRTLSCDFYGQRLLTADFGIEPNVNVWDVETRSVIFNVFRPHGDERLMAASLSPDSRYIVTVGNEPVQFLKIWEPGSPGHLVCRELPDTSYARVNDVCFSKWYPNVFALTSDRFVIFCVYDFQHFRLNVERPLVAKICRQTKWLRLYNTTYSSVSTKAFTGTADGYVLVWDRTSVDCGMRNVQTPFLQNAEITRIVSNKGLFFLHIFHDADRMFFFPLNLGNMKNAPIPVISRQNFVFEKFVLGKHIEMASVHYIPVVDEFIVATADEKIVRMNMQPGKGYCFIQDCFHSTLTAMDADPRRDYVVAADKKRTIYLLNYNNGTVTLRTKIPAAVNLHEIYKQELEKKTFNHTSVTEIPTVKPMVGDGLASHASILKYSPTGDVLICAIENYQNPLENGSFWVLDPNILDPIDLIPYKHTNGTISIIAFSECFDYMAHGDDSGKIAIFKRNAKFIARTNNYFSFLGKLQSHDDRVLHVLFGPSKNNPRLLTFGSKGDLVEYNLPASGPYPNRGLVVTKTIVKQDEYVPRCVAWYPRFGGEEFFLTSNSDCKFKLFGATNQTVQATYLGPIFETPIKRMMVNRSLTPDSSAYMIFATNKEIGLQLLPVDGNPHRVVSVFAHPGKISWMCVSHCNKYLLTVGCGDLCILKWKINFNSVHVMHELGGTELTPYYELISGGKDGFLFEELQKVFVYSQLKKEKNTMGPRNLDGYVPTDYLPNLMRAVGFYPSKNEVKNLMTEANLLNHDKAGKMVKKVDFKDFFKLYVNHRPTYGVTEKKLREIFCFLASFYKSECKSVCSLKKDFLLRILLGIDDDESVTLATRARDQLKMMMFGYATTGLAREILQQESEEKFKEIVNTLPECLCYKDFAAIILGIE